MKMAFISHVHPVLHFASVAWFTGYSGDISFLEAVQRRWTKRITGLQDLSHSERPVCLNLSSIN